MMLFNNKEMKMINDYKKVQKYMLDGIPVFLVLIDGTLMEVTEATDWKLLFFHNLKGGNYAIYRRKLEFGAFSKDISIGKWTFTVSHVKKGGDGSCVY